MYQFSFHYVSEWLTEHKTQPGAQIVQDLANAALDRSQQQQRAGAGVAKEGAGVAKEGAGDKFAQETRNDCF